MEVAGSVSPAQDWQSQWNSRVDICAEAAVWQRAEQFLSTHAAFMAWEEEQEAIAMAFRSLHLDISQLRQMKLERDALAPLWVEGSLWLDGLPLNWQFQLVQHKAFCSLCPEFLLSLLSWPQKFDDTEAQLTMVSRIEFVFVVKHGGHRPMPFPLASDRGEVWSCTEHHRPTHGFDTLASQKRYIVRAFSILARVFSLELQVSQRLDRSALGVFAPQAGFQLRLPAQLLAKTREQLRLFTARGPIRSANDLSRPY